MRQYVVDQLRPGDYEALKEHLDAAFPGSGVDGLYWIPLDPSFLDPVQLAHTDCQPFYFALELERNRLSAELLIRTLGQVKCDCMRYADQRQIPGILAWVDALCGKLDVRT
jgi:hypothetical protein